ncbi:uncharacterized protein C22orf15 [Myripristis murdjan]|uniref:uncharacterized protein C22orf15 n=1 Tax=Myripristis murdjan TaxID=586833 RepID=UPI00117615A0|nr:uncharacterized protein C22orf15 homolog [Myripristis murdjan]
MFVTVLFGENRMELFNLNCKLINFVHCLKERCGLDDKDCVALMDSSGAVMNLEEKQHSVDLASNLLTERQNYILLRVCRDDHEGQKYVSLLNNMSLSHPELTDVLRKLSNPDKERDRKAGRLRKGWAQNDSPVNKTQGKGSSGNKKSHQIK